MKGATALRPVVLVHGIFSDILTSGSRVVWPCKTPLHIGQLKSNVLDYLAGSTNPETLEYESFTGKYVAPAYGVEAIDRLVKTKVLYRLGAKIVDCFDVLISALEKLGYVPGVSLFAYTYDFRQSPLIASQYKAFREFLQRFGGSKPILIAHSMGAQVVKLFMHANADWADLFEHFIAVSGAFDGSTATAMILTLVGYELGVKLLVGCTRFLWANSGMAITLTPGSELCGAVPCIFLRIVDLDHYDNSQLDDPGLWNAVRIEHDDGGFLTAILRRVKAQPEKVRYKARYWIRRFKQFLGRAITIPDFPEQEEPEKYVKVSKCAKPRPELFLQADYSDAAAASPTSSYTVVQVTQWGPDEQHLTPSARIYRVPDKIDAPRDYFSSDRSVDDSALRIAQQLMLDPKLPPDLEFVCERKMSLFDFYDALYPESSLERLLFGSVRPLYELHAKARLTEIYGAERLKFANYSGAGFETPTFVHFAAANRISDLRFVMPQIVFGYGDGSIVLTSQMSDGFRASARKVYAGVRHSDMIREPRVVEDILSTVTAFY